MRLPSFELVDGVAAGELWLPSAMRQAAPGQKSALVRDFARITDFDFSVTGSRLTGLQAEALREFIDPVP